MLKRQLDLLYNAYLGNQLEPAMLEEMTKQSAEIEEIFNTFSYSIDGRTVNNNEINKILREERDPVLLEKAWKSQKWLVKQLLMISSSSLSLRNKAAQRLRF